MQQLVKTWDQEVLERTIRRYEWQVQEYHRTGNPDYLHPRILTDLSSLKLEKKRREEEQHRELNEWLKAVS